MFVERLRREVMSYYVSERRNQIGRMIELITIGYRTLEEARRSILVHDIQRTQHFDEVFGENYEWINDICRRIFALHLWPEGFDEPDSGAISPILATDGRLDWTITSEIICKTNFDLIL